MQAVRRLSPIIIFVVAYLAISNWWRIELLINPVNQRPTAAVELYVTRWCPYCAKAKDYLDTMGVDYQEFDIEKDPAAKRRYDSYPGQGVPLLIIGEGTVRGFDRGAIRHLIEKQAAQEI